MDKVKAAKFARQHGYLDLQSLVAAMELEREAALMVIRSWNGLHPNGRARTPKNLATLAERSRHSNWNDSTPESDRDGTSTME